jgi:D-3-phosphoglycerate dehydrogenase
MHLARTSRHDRAVAIIRLDNEAPKDAVEALRSHPNILSVQEVTL